MRELAVDDKGRNTLAAKALRFVRRERLEGTRMTAALFAGTGTALPIMIFIGQNYEELVQLQPLLFLAAIAALVGAVVSLGLGKVTAPHVAGTMCAALGYVFFSMSWTESEETVSLIIAWLAAGFLLWVVVLWLVGDSASLLAIAAAITTVSCIGSLTAGYLTSHRGGNSPIAAVAFTDEFERTPNVYLIVLDGFSNPRIIEEQFGDFVDGLDFSEPLAQLQSDGFVWEDRARANYAETRLSVPSMLNAEYPLLPGDESDWAVRASGGPALRGHNRLTATFKQAGYEYWHSGSGIWGEGSCDASIADRCLGQDQLSFEALEVMWGNTPLRAHMTPEPEGQTPGKLVESIAAARDQGAIGPYLVYSHLLLPHQPYRFDRECNPKETLSTVSGDHLLKYRPEYAEQALCTAKMLGEAMAELVEMDPEAIIILQADHGAYFLANDEAERWSDSAVRQRMDIFRMTRLPDDCRYEGVAAQSLVNTLPLLRACMTANEPELVEPRQFVTDYYDLFYEIEHPDDQPDSRQE